MRIISSQRSTNSSPQRGRGLRLFVWLPAALAFILAAATAAPSFAQGSQRIAALVNEEVVTQYDLQARIDLIVLSSQLPNTDEMRQRLAPQVLRTLIDDRLRLQESRRQKIAVSEREIESAIGEIEARNKMKPGAMYAMLDQHNIDRGTLRLQIEADLAWRQLVGNQIRATVTITDEAIDEAIDRIEANKGKPEHLISEIFIAIGADRSVAEARDVAERLRQQIVGGANFPELARSFSQSASAAVGGNLGWVRNDQLDQALVDAITAMKPGELSQPIQGIDGFYILGLRSSRLSEGLPTPNLSFTLQQVFVPPEAGDPAARMAIAADISARAKTCEDMDAAGKKLASPQSGRLSDIQLSSLPPAIRDQVTQLKDGQASKPIEIGDGVMVLMICQRKGDQAGDEIRNQIRNMLVGQRGELISRRLLRDLHRSAFVDIRR